MQRIFTAFLLACFASSAIAAIGDKEPPVSWQAELPVRAIDLPTETFPAIDPEQLRQRDADPAKMGEPLQFAEPFASRSDLANSGRWDTLANGDRIWRLRVEVPGATDVNIGFSRFQLPRGASLHIYDTKRTFFQGGWDHMDNAAHGEFWAPVIPGDSAVIELYVPARAQEPELQLEQVAGGYRDFFGHSGGPYMTRQGACNNDVVCPEGDPWRDEIRSVAVYQLNGSWTCTGSLINDVPNSLTPHFLTANHCGISSSNDQSMVVYWNFESPNCGDLSGGSLDDNQSGAIYRASRSDVDMALVELESQPLESFNVHYAGWDRTNTQPGGAVAIHHPSTDEKAISFAESDLNTTPSCIGGSTPDTHWEVPFWDDGTTEPGSSGSGIWNPQNKRLVGFLSGGQAACGNQQYDCYGKFAVAWDGPDSSSRLRDWLDPSGTNPDGIDGTDPDSYNLVPDSTNISQCSFDDIDVNIDVTQAGSFSDPVTLSTTGLPTGVTDAFSINPVTPPGASMLTLGGLNQAGTGSFQFDVEGSGGGLDRSVSIDVTLSNADPADTAVTAPGDDALGVSATPTITWDSAAQAAQYELEIATDVVFSNVVYSATEASTSHDVDTPLDTSTEHFVRVRAVNACGAGNWSPTNSFTTEALPGDCPLGTEATSLLSEGFDGGSIPAGWSTAGSSGPTTWVASSDQAHAGSHSVFAADVDTESDQRLASPSVALPNDATALFLNFQNWQDMESNGSDACFDGGILEISTDGGSSWMQVDTPDLQVREYDGEISTEYNSALAGQQAWCGNVRDFWERYSVDLSAWAGQNVQFRLRFASDASVGQYGWHVDSVDVKACEPAGPPPVFRDRFEQ